MNEFTGESVWEIPAPHCADDAGPAGTDPNGWDQGETTTTAGEPTTSTITDAAEGGHGAAWWADGGEWATSGTFGRYDEWPHGATSSPLSAPAAGEDLGNWGEYWYGQTDETTGGLVVRQEEGDLAAGWTQEWDEGSQSYYWYNSMTGESRW